MVDLIADIIGAQHVKITVKNNSTIAKRVAEKLKRKRDVFGRELLFEITEIRTRTRRGIEVDGGTFADYTPAYAKRKSSPNSRGQSRQISPPDLTFTGQMLANLMLRLEDKAERLTGIIFFGDAREKLKAKGNNQKRNFFGIEEKRKEALKQRVNEA